MDHLVYMDKSSNELDNLINSTKDIILRGATGRKLPYGRCKVGDVLYLANNNGDGLIRAKCLIKTVEFTDKLSVDESNQRVDEILDRVILTDKVLSRFRGKRYLSIVVVENVVELPLQPFDKSEFGNMDDWLLIESIDNIT